MRQFMHASVMVLASTMLHIGRTKMWWHGALGQSPNDGVGEHRVAGRPHDDVVTPHRRRQRRNAGRHRAGLPAPSHHILLGANSPQMMVLANTVLQVGPMTSAVPSLRRTAGSG